MSLLPNQSVQPGRGESVRRFGVSACLRFDFSLAFLAAALLGMFAMSGLAAEEKKAETKAEVKAETKTETKAEPLLAVPDGEGINWTKEKQFWSFRAPIAQTKPTVKNKKWPAQPL